jgi:hypothetical protein
MADFDPTATTAVVPHGGTTPARTPTPVRPIAQNVEQTDFTDESVRKYEFELYSGKANQTDRIYIPNASGVVRARTHYIERGAAKFSIICRSQYVRRSDGSGEDLVQEGACCKMFGNSVPRWAVLIIQYATDKTGQVTRPFTMHRKLWKFGADKYQQIRNVGRDFPLEHHDLSVFCQPDGEQYQKLQIGAKPDCFVMHPQFPPDDRKQIQDWAKANVGKLPREMGRSYANEAELLRDLQQAGVTTAVGPAPTMASDAPIANFEDIVGSVVPQPPK